MYQLGHSKCHLIKRHRNMVAQISADFYCWIKPEEDVWSRLIDLPAPQRHWDKILSFWSTSLRGLFSSPQCLHCKNCLPSPHPGIKGKSKSSFLLKICTSFPLTSHKVVLTAQPSARGLGSVVSSYTPGAQLKWRVSFAQRKNIMMDVTISSSDIRIIISNIQVF